MTERAILHIDMDAFFASVEMRDDPRLRGKPVIVGGTPEGRGVVAAASYEARRYGVHSAMSAARARKLCPHGVFLKPSRGRYSEASSRIFTIFNEYTPVVEPLSIDEAFLDVSGCRRLFGKPQQIGREIKERLDREVGLPASVGLAPNKFLAKLASDLEKPDGFVVIGTADAVERLAPLPVGKLWGVGRRTQEVLAGIGVRRVADLGGIPRPILEARLGESLAAHLLDLAVGRDDRPVIPDHEAVSIGHEVTFARDISDTDRLRDEMDELVEKTVLRLRRAGLKTRTITVKARFPDFSTVTRSETLSRPTASRRLIREVARRLLEQKVDRRGSPLRLIGVSVAQLGGDAAQGDLFVGVEADADDAIDGLLDDAAGRFGAGVIRRGIGRTRAADRNPPD